MKRSDEGCPCGSGRPYADCCGRLHSGVENAATAEALMRSRYSAYAQGREAYLLATWHPTTRPAALDLGEGEGTKWLALDVRQCRQPDPTHATVEFVARFRHGGRGGRMHEISRFVLEGDRWFYVDGQVD